MTRQRQRWCRRLRLAPLLLAAAVLAAQAMPAFADRWWDTQAIIGVVDAGRQPDAARRAGVGWDRVQFLWQEIQPSSSSDWTLDRYLDQTGQRKILASGRPIVAVVQGTPGWAAGNWHDGASGVPTGLDYPPDDPKNNFGRFMLRLASSYKGRIDAWIIWNEPDFHPGESGTWWTWSGNTADFFSLLRTGYRAVKQADPRAAVVFPATTYFADAVNGRELFLGRVLSDGAKDREAAAHGYYFDAVAVNIYCSLDVVYRVRGIYADILARYKLDKPIWLTETNCPVYNDATAPVTPSHHISTSEQAAYLLEVVAVARAAGYQRIAWYSMIDHDPNTGIADRWGLLRLDASPRPALTALAVATKYLSSSAQTARLAPIGDAGADGWPVWRVVLNDPTRQSRIHVLWRSARGPTSLRVEALGTVAELVDVQGRVTPLTRDAGGWWTVPLPPPRVSQPFDPPGFQLVGDPVLLVETGLPIAASPEAPRTAAVMSGVPGS